MNTRRINQGLFTLLEWPLLEGIFAFSKAKRVPYITIYKRLITKLGAKMCLALRVAAKKSPLVAARRSFGITKLRSSRLN